MCYPGRDAGGGNMTLSRVQIRALRKRATALRADAGKLLPTIVGTAAGIAWGCISFLIWMVTPIVGELFRMIWQELA